MTNKEIVLSFLETYLNADGEKAKELLADDLSWTTMLSANTMPQASAPRNKEALVADIAGVKNGYPSGVKFNIVGVTAEGERVAVEATSDADVYNGKKYNNVFHFLFIVKDGKISVVREYCDFMHVMSIFQ